MTAPWLVSPPVDDLSELAAPGALSGIGSAPSQVAPSIGIRESGTTRASSGADINNVIYFNNAVGCLYTVNLPLWPNAVAFVNDGEGTVTIGAGAGVTINTAINTVATSALLLPGPTAGTWYLINSTDDPGGAIDAEAVQDIIGAMVVAVGGAYIDGSATLIFPGGNIPFAAPTSFPSSSPNQVWDQLSMIASMSGSATITTFGACPAGNPTFRFVYCIAAPKLAHSSAISCPDNIDLQLRAGDVYAIANIGSTDAIVLGVWRKRQNTPTEVTYAQFAALSPVDRQQVVITDITDCPFPGLHLIYSNSSGSWKPFGGRQTYYENHTPIIVAAASAVEQLIKAITLKAGIPYKNVLDCMVTYTKDGTTDTATNLRARINTAANLSGNSLYADSTGLIAANLTKGASFVLRFPDTANVIREGVPGNNLPFEPTASSTATQGSVATGGNIATTDHFINLAATGNGTTNKQGVAYVRIDLVASN